MVPKFEAIFNFRIQKKGILNLFDLKNHYPQRCTILSTFRPVGLLARFLGILPVRSLGACQKLQIIWISWKVFYALIISLVIHLSIYEVLILYVQQQINKPISAFGIATETDNFTLGLFLITYLSLRFLTHFLALVKSPKFVKLLQNFIDYDEEFGIENKAKIINWPGVVIIIGSFVNIMGTFLEGLKGLKKVIMTENEKILPQMIFQDSTVTAVYLCIIHAIGEAALVIFFLNMFFMTTMLIQRYQDVSQKFKFYIKHYNQMKKLQSLNTSFKINSNNSEVENIFEADFCKFLDRSYESIKRLIGLSHQVNLYTREFITISTVGSIAVLISGIYYIINLMAFEAKRNPQDANRIQSESIALIITCIVYTSRIIVLFDCGEKLQNVGEEIGNTFDLCNSSNFHKIIGKKVKCLQRIGSRTSKIGLDAFGYFQINRICFTTMIGSVVTFVIVLAQFRLADLSKTI